MAPERLRHHISPARFVLFHVGYLIGFVPYLAVTPDGGAMVARPCLFFNGKSRRKCTGFWIDGVFGVPARGQVLPNVHGSQRLQLLRLA